MAAAQSMARGEHQGISPLVVHGPSGVGKSRLLAGLVAERLRREPGSAVAHLDAETFAASYAEASGDGRKGDGWSALRGRLREVDLLILEDLEGLARAPASRDELAHTLDALETAGAAVAVSARTAPSDLAEAGVAGPADQPVAGRPDRADRPARPGRAPPICPPSRRDPRPEPPGRGRRAAGRDGRRLPHPRRLARPARARRPDRVEAQRRQGPRPRRRDRRRHPGRGGTPGHRGRLDRVDRAERWPSRFGVRLGLVRGPSRRASVVAARHLAMHLAREHTGSSFAAIGAYFGDRDPATVRHACRAAIGRLAADPGPGRRRGDDHQ